jgi:creatinine amidohydrolase/Fe(II)-dependent formamide hydrolase-like protein
MTTRMLEELRPRQIMAAVRRNGLVFLPISPCLEWHSWHLPLGVDGLIAEELARALARRLRAVYCRALPLGLDEWRSRAFKRCMGLPPTARVFGMNFPALPLRSEYHTPALLRGMLRARLEMLRGCGFRTVVVLNHHGGRGQLPLLEATCRAAGTAKFHVLCLQTGKHCTLQPPAARARQLRVGGHAGMLETLQFMAVRPELVALRQLPKGRLRVAAHGILHHEPIIAAADNPRGVSSALARAWRRNVLENITAAVVAALRQS